MLLVLLARGQKHALIVPHGLDVPPERCCRVLRLPDAGDEDGHARPSLVIGIADLVLLPDLQAQLVQVAMVYPDGHHFWVGIRAKGRARLHLDLLLDAVGPHDKDPVHIGFGIAGIALPGDQVIARAVDFGIGRLGGNASVPDQEVGQPASIAVHVVEAQGTPGGGRGVKAHGKGRDGRGPARPWLPRSAQALAG